MFGLIYISYDGRRITPQILEVSKNRTNLLSKLMERANQICIDEVGRKNHVDTLEHKDITIVEFPIYPNTCLKRISENQIEIHRVEKKSVVEKGYLYNSTKDIIETKCIGSMYVLDVEQWNHEDLPSRPVQIKSCIEKSIQTDGPEKSMVKNYDRVILQLIESIQKRKID